MWQRIQTIFLLLAVGLLVALFFVPAGQDGTASCVVGIFMYTSPPGVVPTLASALLLLATALSLWALFSFRRRRRQLRLCRWNGVVVVGLQVVLACYTFSTGTHRLIPAWFPVAVLVLLWLAARYIRRDERLVRDADRLR
jgi:hypothetical protein